MTRKFTRGTAQLAASVALAAVFATLMVGAASAATTKVPVWESGGAHLPYGKEVALKGEPITGLSISWFGSTTENYLSCRSMQSNGFAENYAAETPGLLKNNAAGTGFTFVDCIYNPGEYKLCNLSQAPKLTFSSAQLSDAEDPNGALVLTKGLITINTKGCAVAKTFTVPFSATLFQSEIPGEFRLRNEVGVTVGPNSEEGQLRGLGIRVVSEGQPVTVGQETAEVGPPFGRHWYRGGGGRRGEGPKVLLPSGSPTLLGLGSTSMTLQSVQSGVAVTVACNGQGSVGGSAENPAGGGVGTGSISLSETSCVVQKPAGHGCVVTGGGITTKSLPVIVANPSEEASQPLLNLKPSNEEIATFSISGCSITALNHVYTFQGYLVASSTGNRERPFAILASQNETTARLFGQKVTVGGLLTPETGSGEIVSMG